MTAAKVSVCILCGHEAHRQHVPCGVPGCTCTHGPWLARPDPGPMVTDEVKFVQPGNGKEKGAVIRGGKPLVNQFGEKIRE